MFFRPKAPNLGKWIKGFSANFDICSFVHQSPSSQGIKNSSFDNTHGLSNCCQQNQRVRGKMPSLWQYHQTIPVTDDSPKLDCANNPLL